MALDLPKALHIDHMLDGVYISGWQATQFADYLRQITPPPILWESLIRYFNFDYTIDDALIWMRRAEGGPV